MGLQADWATTKKLVIGVLDKAIKMAELEEKALPAKAKHPKTDAAKSVRAGFSTCCRAVDTCCIAFDEAIEAGDKKKALSHLNTFKNCWGVHLDTLSTRNNPASPFVTGELKNLDNWFEKKHAAMKKSEKL